jgi:hypothetical protein
MAFETFEDTTSAARETAFNPVRAFEKALVILKVYSPTLTAGY